jgi:two-component system response regulator (stage 0 sporulation protein F)
LPDAHPSPDARPMVPAQPLRILLAEDDSEMRRLLAWSLRQAGYDVVECKDGMSLMHKLGFLDPLRVAPPIDLIVSDIRMPGFTGFQVLESTREFEEGPPIILISAFADEEAQERARRLGAEALLSKPFEMSVLLDQIQRLDPPRFRQAAGRSESTPPAPQDLPFPLEVTFRHSSGAEPVKDLIGKLAGKLSRFGPRITHCRVVVDRLNHGHPEKHSYEVSLVISTPGQPIIVEHSTGRNGDEGNLYLALQIAFGVACRRLKQSRRKRGDYVGIRGRRLPV